MKRFGSPKLVTAVIAAAVVLAAVAAYVLVVSPERSKASRLAGEIATTQTALETALRDARSGRDQQTVQVADVFRLAKAMPGAVDMPDMLLQLNSLADASGVSFRAITPGVLSAAAIGGYETQPIALVFQGNYRELSGFLARVRNLIRVNRGVLHATGRLFNVDSIAFSESAEKFPQLQATLNVESYVYTGTPTGGAGTFTTGATPTQSTSSSTQAAASSTGATS